MAVFWRYEKVARHLPHGLQDALVAQVSPDELLVHHILALPVVERFLIHFTSIA
jgi:hypothetical protein